MKTLLLLLLMVTVTPSGHPVRALESSEVIKATPILNVQQTWIGQPISYPVGEAELSGVVIEMAPGGETGWHQHPVPSVGYVMEGELEVHFKDGEIKYLKAGEAAAEAINVLHNGVNNGDTPVKLVIFYIGRVGSQLTIPENTE